MKISDFLKERKRLLIGSLISFIIFTVLFQFLSSRVSVAFTIKGQECFPYKFWLIKKGEIPKKGEYVAFKNPKISQRATWIKVITGVGGDRIEVERISEEQRRKSPDLFNIYIEEIGKELTLQGFVYLHSQNPADEVKVFNVFKKDTKGRDLPIIEGGRIPGGSYFISSPALRSYDSRYWGLIDESNIIGKAYPIL